MKNISGQVLDENGRPIEAALVFINGRRSAVSGRGGHFSATTRTKGRLAVTFEKDGYVKNTKVLDSVSAGFAFKAILRKINFSLAFDASKDLVAELGGVRISLSGNSLLNAKSQSPVSEAVLQLTPLDVIDTKVRQLIPGDYIAKVKDGKFWQLRSFAMWDMNIVSSLGRRVELRKGARIDLSLSIPKQISEYAPKEIGYFNFDYASGMWVHIGNFALDLSGLTYNGSTTSFGGANNLDDEQLVVCVTVRVVKLSDGTPVPSAYVTAVGPQSNSNGTTNSNGLVCLLVPRNSVVSVSASANIGGSSWITIPGMELAFTSPNFASTCTDCGNDQTCPYLGDVTVDLIVG